MLLTSALDMLVRERADLAPTTVANYASAIRSLDEHAQIRTTGDLSRARVAAWLIRRKEEGINPRGLNVKLAGLCSILSSLERQGLFPLSKLMQIRRVRLRADPPPEPVYLSGKELARLRAAAISVHSQLDLAISLAVFGGMRRKELLHLHREDLAIDGEHAAEPFIRVLRIRGRIKTKRSRSCPIARQFADELRRREFAPGPIFPPLADGPSGPPTYLAANTLVRWLTIARDRADLPQVSWTVLRHCFACYLRQGGVGLSQISGWMGNSVRTCETFYSIMGPQGDLSVEKGLHSSPTVDDEPAPGGGAILRPFGGPQRAEDQA